MTNSIRVSILVPIYNVEKFIGKCLDSIFSQTYTNVNYVFADDCSTDNSLTVLQSKLAEYSISSERYTIIRHSENKGIAKLVLTCWQKRMATMYNLLTVTTG